MMLVEVPPIRSIADDCAVFVFGPIRKAQVIGADVLIPSPNGCRRGQRRPSSAVAVGHDVVSRLEVSVGKQLLQLIGGPEAAGVEEVCMRKQPCPGQMTAARIAPEIFASELTGRPCIENPDVFAEFGLQGLSIDKPDRSRSGPCNVISNAAIPRNAYVNAG